MTNVVRKTAGGEHGGFGWLPDLPDHRDKLFTPSPLALKQVPDTPVFDLADDPAMPQEIWDQGQLGSCTAQSVGCAFAFAHVKAGLAEIMPARLWIYYQERVIEDTVNEDSGAMIRDGFKVCANAGVPPEDDWPYDITTFVGPPPDQASTDAVLHKGITYDSIPQTEDLLKAALLNGFPVSFGFSVYESFETAEVAKTGLMPMPGREALLGGHAVLIVGWDDTKQGVGANKPGMFKVRNSWSADWGDGGHFWMPYEYALNVDLADDFWQVTVAT